MFAFDRVLGIGGYIKVIFDNLESWPYSATVLPPIMDTTMGKSEVRDFGMVLEDLESELGIGDQLSRTTDDSSPPSESNSVELPYGSRRAMGESGLDTLGGGMRKMVDMVNKLRATGIEGLGLGLPRIAVVGNQSAGKSSLIEAISGIKVPRYTGTCTRCPLEINLSEAVDPSSLWHCKISLRFNKRYVSQARRGNNPWLDQPVEQHLFMELTSKDEVEQALVKAQSAVLNPSRRWKEFTVDSEDDTDEGYEVKFSPNVVCMEITGRGLPNLAFIDLPGIIQTTESESEDYLIDLVNGLVKEYVKEEDCLILLAMTMRDDAVNQSAARFAREMGEERTIGALTKPDTVCPGEFQQWIEILRGKAHRLKHGYFVTKQPSQDQLLSGINHAQAREAEERFFATTEPWATELADISERFGTVALTKYLAEKLGERIRLRLPGIVETIKRQADEVQQELDNLPPPATDNHFFLIQNILTKFSLVVGEYIQGGSGGEKNKLQMGLKTAARELGRILETGRPRIQWALTEEEELMGSPERAGQVREETPTPNPRKGQSSSSIISLDSDDDRFTNVASSKRSPDQLPVTPRKRVRTNGLNTISDSQGSNTFTLLQLNKIIESHSNGQIPDQVDSRAIEYLVRRTLLSWKSPLYDYLDSCQRLLLDIIHSVFQKKFTCYQKTRLYSISFKIIESFLHAAFNTATDIVLNRIYKLERDQIATMDEKSFKSIKSHHLDRLLEARSRNREEQREAKKRRLAHEAMSPRKRALEEKKLAVLEKEQALPGNDRFANEIELMAGARAYYELASRRFVDNVFMSILGEWIGGVKSGLGEELWTRLGFNEGDVHEKAKALLEEDPEKERRRRGLQVKREQLRKAMEELNRL